MSALFVALGIVALTYVAVYAAVELTERDPSDYPPLASDDTRSAAEVLRDVPEPTWDKHVAEAVNLASVHHLPNGMRNVIPMQRKGGAAS